MKVLLPFHDDSTLLFAAKLMRFMSAYPIELVPVEVFERPELGTQLSDRQINMLIEGGASHQQLLPERLTDPTYLETFDAVIVAKAPTPLRHLLTDPAYRARKNRPKFPGVPDGYRIHAEAWSGQPKALRYSLVNRTSDVSAFENVRGRESTQHVAVGHPYFLRPAHFRTGEIRSIYFFVQAISPKTFNGRLHMLRLLVELAKRHPDKSVAIKLRHRPNENLIHVHPEEYSYQWLADNIIGELPENLVFSDVSMDEALADADCCLTCTSTAAMDFISAGLPTMVYLDYVECYADPLNTPMADLFADSNVVSSLEDVLSLNVRKPSPLWIDDNFCSAQELEDEICRAIGLTGHARTTGT